MYYPDSYTDIPYTLYALYTVHYTIISFCRLCNNRLYDYPIVEHAFIDDNIHLSCRIRRCWSFWEFRLDPEDSSPKAKKRQTKSQVLRHTIKSNAKDVCIHADRERERERRAWEKKTGRAREKRYIHRHIELYARTYFLPCIRKYMGTNEAFCRKKKTPSTFPKIKKESAARNR